eukprot:CAMPEP_0202845634 /NCGR_PEP_ID=MMETSP1389-20130828/70480_1 /ASSEMBLY_ACC=CAM_ASM_000865 /TAXON_ID=302021 /ORGANISM="Rhodomonas sp., Strain CCMP768" /LENGTH=54 /DNA_ID=CAMNT_0049523093 /DNA_START=111 /DNA_END=272 /DNA_ORIENTATION=+
MATSDQCYPLDRSRRPSHLPEILAFTQRRVLHADSVETQVPVAFARLQQANFSG